ILFRYSYGAARAFAALTLILFAVLAFQKRRALRPGRVVLGTLLLLAALLLCLPVVSAARAAIAHGAPNYPLLERADAVTLAALLLSLGLWLLFLGPLLRGCRPAELILAGQTLRALPLLLTAVFAPAATVA